VLWHIRDIHLQIHLIPFLAIDPRCQNWRSLVFNAVIAVLSDITGFGMLKIGFSIAVLATTAAMGFASCSIAISQPAVAAGKKVASIHAESSPRRRASATQVYLLRGLLNVFSLGMDSLADELHSAGISATVANHTSWQSMADEIAANYRAGQRGPIVLVGHSLGADAVMEMGDYLGQKGVPVSLIVPFDGRNPHAASANVARVLNFYKNDDVKITRGPGFHGELNNYYAADPSVTHFNIDKYSRFHAMVVRKVRGLQSTVARPQEHLDNHT
jgi:thioesterase superfamily protein